jgi:hypothetical protein
MLKFHKNNVKTNSKKKVNKVTNIKLIQKLWLQLAFINATISATGKKKHYFLSRIDIIDD